MFKNMDTDRSGTITFEELKSGLTRLGSKLSESEIRQLMDAVSSVMQIYKIIFMPFIFIKQQQVNFVTHFSFFTCFARLMLTRMGLSTILNSLLPLCTGINLRRKRIYIKLFNILTRIIVGKYSLI